MFDGSTRNQCWNYLLVITLHAITTWNFISTACHQLRSIAGGTFSPQNVCLDYLYTFQAPEFISFKLTSSFFDLQDIDGIKNVIDFLFQLFLQHSCALACLLKLTCATSDGWSESVWGSLSIFLTHMSSACSYCFVCLSLSVRPFVCQLFTTRLAFLCHSVTTSKWPVNAPNKFSWQNTVYCLSGYELCADYSSCLKFYLELRRSVAFWAERLGYAIQTNVWRCGLFLVSVSIQ